MVCRNVGPLTFFLLTGGFVTSTLTEYKKAVLSWRKERRECRVSCSILRTEAIGLNPQRYLQFK